MVSLNTYICSSPALTQSQSNAKNIYVSNRSYSILRWLMIIKLNLWVKKAICSVKAFAPHMCFVIRQKVMDTTVKTYLYEPFFIVILKRCLYTMGSKTLFLSCIHNFSARISIYYIWIQLQILKSPTLDKVHNFWEGKKNLTKLYVKLLSSVKKSLEISSYFCGLFRICEANSWWKCRAEV